MAKILFSLAAFLLAVMPSSRGSSFEGARWIGGNAQTCPDYDFGDARWIAPRAGSVACFERRFVLEEKPKVAELVFVARERFAIEINGLRRFAGAARDIVPVGAFHDWRFAKFIDVAPALRKGVNVIRLEVSAPTGERPAVLLSLTMPGGVRIVTDGSWANAEDIGGLRDVAWTKDVILRREVNSPGFAGCVPGGSVCVARVEKGGVRGFAAVAEGKNACATYLAARSAGGRCDVLVHGVDVCADLPEAAAFLDGVVDHCLEISKVTK